MRISDWSSDVCSSDLEVLLCLLHALSARPRLEDVDGDPEFAQGSRALNLSEHRLERLGVRLETPLQTVDGRDRSTVLRIAVIVVDVQEGQGGLGQEHVEDQVEITGDDRTGVFGQERLEEESSELQSV